MKTTFYSNYGSKVTVDIDDFGQDEVSMSIDPEIPGLYLLDVLFDPDVAIALGNALVRNGYTIKLNRTKSGGV